MKMNVVIPTHNRIKSLQKLLNSIKESNFNLFVETIFIVENGSFECKNIKNDFPSLPIKYYHLEQGNKSYALNWVIKKMPENKFIIFFDDDITVHKNIFKLYYETVKLKGDSFYYGGPMEPVYDTAPNTELIPFLPSSAKGYKQKCSEAFCNSDKVTFMGCNWGAFCRQLINLGGFNTNLGPGTGARGQESNMMKRLYKSNVLPIYINSAIVYHYVPPSGCSMDWVINRHYQMGLSHGIQEKNLFRIAKNALVLILLFAINKVSSSKLQNKIKLTFYKGIIAGYLKTFSIVTKERN